jgi:hypothetical protein
MADGGTQETGVAQSTFVTVVAWIFIVISGFATLLSTMQVAAFYYLISKPIVQALHNPHDPQFPGFSLEHQWIFVLGFWLAALLTLVAAIGLLRRANWGRIMLIAMLAIGIVWNLGGMIIQGFLLSGFPGTQARTFPDAEMNTMAIATVAVAALFAIVLSVLFGWIIKRLISPRIRAEFGAT